MSDTHNPTDTTSESSFGQITLAIASLGALATYLDTTILFVAFPDITNSFGDSSTSALSRVLNAYTITIAALLVPSGKLADRLGHRLAFLVGSSVFTAASMLCGLAPSLELFVVFRVFQGAGAAILVPASLALVMAAFPREKLPQVIAIWGAIGAFSAALGPALGGAIVNGLGWRWVFFLNLPIGIVTLLAGSRFLRESKDSTVRIPKLLGVVLVAGAAGVLSYGIVESDAAGWGSPQTAITLAVGLVLLATFIFHQKQTDAPTLDLELFAIGNFRWGSLAMFTFAMGFGSMFFGSILFMVNVWGWSILKAGLAIAPSPALVAVLAPRFGKVAGRIGQRPLVLLGGLFLTTSGLYWRLILTIDAGYWVGFVAPLILVAFATALIFPSVTSVAAQALPQNRVGVGGAAIQAVRQFGMTFGVAVTLAFIGSAPQTAELFIRFNRIWYTLIILGLLTTLCGLPLKTKKAA